MTTEPREVRQKVNSLDTKVRDRYTAVPVQNEEYKEHLRSIQKSFQTTSKTQFGAAQIDGKSTAGQTKMISTSVRFSFLQEGH